MIITAHCYGLVRMLYRRCCCLEMNVVAGVVFLLNAVVVECCRC